MRMRERVCIVNVLTSCRINSHGEIFMPIPACCIKGNFYAKSALLYSKGGLYASDVGINYLMYMT